MLLQPLPPGFKDHKHTFTVNISARETDIWDWLNDTKTFTDNQIWPYKVEFYSPNPEIIPNGFNEGVFTNHTGPLINFAGQLMEIKENYRDLQYFYGSYAISFKWVRPYRLEFKTTVIDEDSTDITCTISSYVKPGIYKLWDKSQQVFWRRFRKWATKSIRKNIVHNSNEVLTTI